MKAEDIENKYRLEVWLRELPESVRRMCSAQLAQRAACRVLPLFARWENAEYQVKIQPTWRANLTSAVFSLKEVTPPNCDAAADAFYPGAVYYAADAAHEALAVLQSTADFETAVRAVVASTGAQNAAGHRARADVWYEVVEDALKIERGEPLLSAPLWSYPMPDWFTGADIDMRSRLTEYPPGTWDFWLRWWDGVLSGQQIDWKVQEAVALIPDDIWQAGPGAVAEAIREVEKGLHRLPETQSVDHLLARIAPAESKALVQFSQSIWAHRHDLPPTLDAVLGYCFLEIERLQTKNYRDDDDRDECRRQIGVLRTIHEAVSRLSQSIIVERPMTPDEAELPEKLTRVYVRSFKEWPRKNADDLVDSSYRAAFMGATVLALPMIGVPVTIAAGFGAMLFGGKKVADAIKAAKDVAGPAP